MNIRALKSYLWIRPEIRASDLNQITKRLGTLVIVCASNDGFENVATESEIAHIRPYQHIANFSKLDCPF